MHMVDRMKYFITGLYVVQFVGKTNVIHMDLICQFLSLVLLKGVWLWDTISCPPLKSDLYFIYRRYAS